MRANAFDSTLIKSFPSPTVCSTECEPDRYTLVRRYVSAQNLLVAIKKYLNSQKIYTYKDIVCNLISIVEVHALQQKMKLI